MSTWPSGIGNASRAGRTPDRPAPASTGSLVDPDETFDDDDALNASLLGIGADQDVEPDVPTLRSLAPEDETEFDDDPAITSTLPGAARSSSGAAARPQFATQPDLASHTAPAQDDLLAPMPPAPSAPSTPARTDDFDEPDADEQRSPDAGSATTEAGRTAPTAGGFADPQGTVRVWLDDQQLISRVRISPNWRERLHGTRGLEMVFTVVFLAIGEQNPTELPRPTLTLDDETRHARHPLSWEAMNALHQRDQDLMDQIAALPSEALGRWVGDQAVGHSREGSTSITLTPTGQLQTVHFSKSFMDEASVEAIEASVVEAHRDAKARYEPLVYEPGEADRLTNELQQNRLELLAMMRRGFQ